MFKSRCNNQLALADLKFWARSFFILIAAISVLAKAIPAFADIIARPNTYSSGQILTAASLNANFDTIYNNYNGNIVDANIKAAAAISLAKLNLTQPALDLLALGNYGWAVGVTGDTQPRIAMLSDGALLFGPGGATAQDIGIFRSSSTVLAIRNAANNADRSLNALDITLTGTLTLPSQAANRVFASPNGSSGVPTFRALVNADLPSGTLLIGGNGADSAITISSNTTESNPRYINATTYTVNTAITHTIASQTIINTTSTATINGTLTNAQDIAGGTIDRVAGGPAPGIYPIANPTFAAPGGGCGGAGGNIGGGSGHDQGGGGAAQPLVPGLTGSGGGATRSDSTMPGGAAAGTFAILSVGNITNAASGVINSTGANGTDTAINGQGGAGGGSGGVIRFYSLAQVINSGTINNGGGRGGNSTGTTTRGGGGGGGGWIVMMSPTAPTPGTINNAGGAGGTGSSGNGQAGGTGRTLILTGTPSFPLIALHEKYMRIMMEMAAFYDHDSDTKVYMSQKENISLMAALDSKTSNEFYVCYTKLNRCDDDEDDEDIVIADVVNIGGRS